MKKLITRLKEGALIDKSKNKENKKSTIRGWKRYFFKITLLFRKLKKFSSGYNLEKKQLTHRFSKNPKIEKIKVNKKDS